MHAINNDGLTAAVACTTVIPTRRLPDMVDDVRESLLQQPRSLSPKYFYDERGSELFDSICSTPEYYPTRTENRLLKRHGKRIIRQSRPGQILELGSGYSVKTRRLFDACEEIEHDCDYAPFDVCEQVLIDSAIKLSVEYGWLSLNPLLGDYHGGLGNLPDSSRTRLFVFLGSTIGNFEQTDALEFIKELNSVMKPDDHLLLGVDRVKKTEVLNAAYNDAQGLTAEFNSNVLRVLNRELDADFNIDEFTHLAKFNSDQGRIEMRLVSKLRQNVHINTLDESIHFEQGEDILTEISQKYTFTEIESLLSAAGLKIIDHFEDEKSYFSLLLATK